MKKIKKKKVCLNLPEADIQQLKAISNKNLSSLSREVTILIREKIKKGEATKCI